MQFHLIEGFKKNLANYLEVSHINTSELFIVGFLAG